MRVKEVSFKFKVFESLAASPMLIKSLGSEFTKQYDRITAHGRQQTEGRKKGKRFKIPPVCHCLSQTQN